MKSVLISIQPRWCELIASGRKTVEVRKTRPKLETPFKVYIYQTKESRRRYTDHRFNSLFSEKTSYASMGKVIGEFVCDSIEHFTKSFFDEQEPRDTEEIGFLLNSSCLSYNELCTYVGKSEFYGWNISDLVIYDKPRELSEFKRFCDGVGGNIGCRGCKYYYYESSEDGSYEECLCDNLIPLKRPFQSWGYVEAQE